MYTQLVHVYTTHFSMIVNKETPIVNSTILFIYRWFTENFLKNMHSINILQCTVSNALAGSLKLT